MKKKILNIIVIIGIASIVLPIGIKAATSIAASMVTYNGTTVQAKLDELISIASQCPDDALCSKVKIGDYVRMTPSETTYTILASETGYTSDKTINPSELNLWRVIKINIDGTIDMVSVKVSSVSVYFRGQTGYKNFVGVLNTIANQYGNSKYTIRTRHMGYNGQTATLTDTASTVDSTSTTAPWTLSTSDNSNETKGGGDTLYKTDTNLVKAALGTLVARNSTGTATYYWLASRSYGYSSSSSSWNYSGRCVSTSGGINISHLYRYISGFETISLSGAVRPIVTLKSDITNATGSGTSADPWVLS